MKKLSTIQSLCVLVLFALCFTSCDVGDLSTKVSIRFENVSAQDIQLVTVDGLIIDEIKTGEATEYFDFKDIEISSSQLPDLDITSDAFEQTYTYTYQEYDPLYCGIICGTGNYNDDRKSSMLAKGNYTIQLNADVRTQSTSENKRLIVSLVQD